MKKKKKIKISGQCYKTKTKKKTTIQNQWAMLEMENEKKKSDHSKSVVNNWKMKKKVTIQNQWAMLQMKNEKESDHSKSKRKLMRDWYISYLMDGYQDKSMFLVII